MPKVSPEHLEARRHQILDAALTCFDRAGFHGASMQDIVAEVGLSTGAVYRYFSSKEEIIEALAEERHAKEAALINEALQIDDPSAAMHRLADLYFDWLTDPDEQRRRRLGVQIWAEAVHNDRLRAAVQAGADQRRLLTGLLERAKDQQLLSPDADADAMTRVYLALFQGFLVQQAWQPDLDVSPYLRQIHLVIDSTLTAPVTARSAPVTARSAPVNPRSAKTSRSASASGAGR
jgi:TetR/AcrR family transcriptional regulator, repressor for uid operon